MVRCPYFTTNYLQLNSTIQKENTHDSFIIYICVEGEAEIQSENFSEKIVKGETILVPASINSFQITSKNATLLEVYV
jgi:mannose-6-phosphate isomerase